jgi:hypothetical protein
VRPLAQSDVATRCGGVNRDDGLGRQRARYKDRIAGRQLSERGVAAECTMNATALFPAVVPSAATLRIVVLGLGDLISRNEMMWEDITIYRRARGLGHGTSKKDGHYC